MEPRLTILRNHQPNVPLQHHRHALPWSSHILAIPRRRVSLYKHSQFWRKKDKSWTPAEKGQETGRDKHFFSPWQLCQKGCGFTVNPRILCSHTCELTPRKKRLGLRCFFAKLPMHSFYSTCTCIPCSFPFLLLSSSFALGNKIFF